MSSESCGVVTKLLNQRDYKKCLKMCERKHRVHCLFACVPCGNNVAVGAEWEGHAVYSARFVSGAKFFK